MRLLLDTHLLVWSARGATPLPKAREAALAAMVRDPGVELHFSAASTWEIAIKQARRPQAFTIDPLALRRQLLHSGFTELSITSLHCAAVADLPPLHGDPFDRLLIAQATCEGLTLVSVDAEIARYPGPIMAV